MRRSLTADTRQEPGMRQPKTSYSSSENRSRMLRWMSIVLGAASFLIASASYASDEPPVVSAPIAASGVEAPSDVPQVANVETVLWRQFRVNRPDSALIAQAVMSAASRYAVSPIILLAVIATESSFDRHAVSVAGAKGLMQILPAAHPQLVSSGHDLSEPTENIRIGSSILREYLDASGGDLDVALKRYSGGGRGYAQRVAFRMREFSAVLHVPSSEAVHGEFADSH
jgi:soluble lytic murein transglycosylase-like protein